VVCLALALNEAVDEVNTSNDAIPCLEASVGIDTVGDVKEAPLSGLDGVVAEAAEDQELLQRLLFHAKEGAKSRKLSENATGGFAAGSCACVFRRLLFES